MEELDFADGGRGDPHALAGVRAGRGVVAAHHVAAVRARAYDARGHELGLRDLDHGRRVELAVEADEQDAPEVAGRYRRGRPEGVDADDRGARLALALGLDLRGRGGGLVHRDRTELLG